ncbi:hypothetical protein COY59_03175 [Candidatus Gottesmanbacteria bacterium CG_4_10_14_0_8_um_filter_37_24]|uniref:Uncharacterized protein n=2 Tax=Microgenomates group TaxID=1794810 RepID=A0A2M7RQZ5_9BACT|nr:MAG: hypothetical protein COS51_00235 [Candidatus Roizmanbacteria bacterium CG03_land_8_20_14_0_80_36_21]PIV37403.1 MAG: hypothetical protein COS31_04360 [Candidatus Roizmanbacteria bacterium CG02_land_8_20_14_3_00_36_15]PIZ02731.1 MAG: hypothetical protein COY59_03175 [Candidatus Gottesmanbacteria bacterium CG_4_10_14_0_8_um_filter_37_24]PJE60122.1 MAG: hypothetical protein COU86_05995 [Candidatus Roizmanbacteria bacterium CG10_big_fil_rev_8_21_14_0_10_36_26]
MKLPKTLKKLFRFAVDNYFISIFLACIAFVVFVSAYKLFFVKPTYVYVKVKMGQGLWWANTAKPSLWFIKSIKKGGVERDLTRKPMAEILSVRYYPWWGSNQYDVYLTMKLKVSESKSTGKYSFNRSTIGVGAPVDFEFPNAQFSGTIIQMSRSPIKEKFITKTVTLVKKWAFPWEGEAIIIGDKYFDGEETVFKIVGKQIEPSQETYSLSGTYYAVETERKINITLKTKIKLKKEGDELIFGEDQVINLGKTINIATDNFTFSDYVVNGIE